MDTYMTFRITLSVQEIGWVEADQISKDYTCWQLHGSVKKIIKYVKYEQEKLWQSTMSVYTRKTMSQQWQSKICEVYTRKSMTVNNGSPPTWEWILS
jgi:hypothetical protein